jgi:general secretion pathway protein A
MYKEYFGFIEMPFSIVPNARYLFLSSRHREAMNHLQAGLGEGGGFAMLTGEVGTGKTTVSKAMLASLAENIRAGLILNPTFSPSDLLEAICDEFSITYPDGATLKQLSQAIGDYLQANHKQGLQTLLLIDEAQHLSPEVLEQLRLLTNLETDNQKLLKVMLVGQPELQAKLQTSELRQLAQRITGRYHLLPLTQQEIIQYITFRLFTAGVETALFSDKAMRTIAKKTGGVPRIINLACDKALRYAYFAGQKQVDNSHAEKACSDVMAFLSPTQLIQQPVKKTFAIPSQVAALVIGCGLLATAYTFSPQLLSLAEQQLPAPPQAELEATPTPVAKFQWPPAFVRGTGRVEAMQTLYRLWGVRASVLDVNCQPDNPSRFICEQRNGTLAQILRDEQPVILTLQGDTKPLHAVLYAVYDEYVELLSSDKRIRLARADLEQRWQGEYVALWYKEINQTLKPGMQGEDVRRLDTMLATALQEQALNTDRFDQRLASRVEAFQAWQELEVDGIAGRNTLRLLDKMSNGDAPSLRLHAPLEGEEK